MNTPMTLAIVGFFGFGVSNFFWKVAGSKQIYGPSYMIVESVAFSLVAVLIHFSQRHPFELSYRMTALGTLGGILAGISVYCVLLAFRLGGEGSLIFPIARLGVLVSVLLALFVYREPLTTTKFLGLALGMSSIFVLSR